MRHRQLLALLLVGITLVIFWPVHGHQFVVWDDQVNVYENPYLDPVTPSKVLHFWKAPYENLYVPLTYTLWAGIASLTKHTAAQASAPTLDPSPFHAANVFFHILSVVVVFAILRVLVKNDWAGFAGALLFALHPVQVEPVAWVTGMKDVLCGLLSLVAVWQYLKYVATRIRHHKAGKRHYVFATVAFILALFAKPTAIVVPLLIWVLLYFKFSGRDSAVKSLHVSLSLLIWIFVSIPFIFLTKTAQASAISFAAPLWARPLIAGDAVMFYLHKLFLPVKLGVDYGRSPEAVLGHPWIFVTGLLIPYGFGATLWLFRHRVPWLVASVMVFMAGLLPVLGLVSFAFQDHSTVADRYLYLAMLGPAMSFAWFFQWSSNKKKRRIVQIVCILILSALAIQSARQVQYWQNNVTLFRHALAVNAHSSLSHNNLGLALANNGKTEDAVIHYRKALSLKPENPQALNNLAGALMERGETEKAISLYGRALSVKPDYERAHSNLGVALAKVGNLKGAIIHFQKAVEIKPAFAGGHFNLANALKTQGNIEEATEHFHRALCLQPDFPDAHYNLANALMEEGQTPEAIAQFRKALALKPNDPEAHNNLAIALAGLGKTKEATIHFQKALQIKPDFEEAQANLSVVVTKQGNSW